MTTAYPATLPSPIRAPIQSAERRILSTIPGPRVARILQRQHMAGQEIEFVFTYAEAQIFADWVKNVLVDGGAWFLADWPLPQGGLGMRRFVGAPSSPVYVPTFGWHVTAQCIVLDPGEFACIPWTQSGEVPGVSVPVVFGSGSICARDPVTGYIWSCWTTQSVTPETPVGGSTPLTGSFVLVYDPIALTLLTAIRLGDYGDPFLSIIYLAGKFYVGIDANHYTSDHVVSKLDAATRTLISQGVTDYLGAVSHLGLLSRDKNSLYISIPSGVGSGTANMEADAPFAMTGGEAATNWYFNSCFNPFSGVRVYTGYGAFVDLRGAVNMTVSTSGYIASSHLLETRLLVKPCSPIIFLLDVNNAGVLAVNTLTGGVQVITATMTGKAMYYSPESDTLYIEGQDPFGSGTVVKAYQGTTFEPRGSFPTYVVNASGNHGNSVYIGGESFVAAEEIFAGSHLWRLSFPH